MNREPNRILHTYELNDRELHQAIRTYLGIPEEQVIHIEWNAYGNAADAEVTVPLKQGE